MSTTVTSSGGWSAAASTGGRARWMRWRGPWLFAVAAGLIVAAPALVSIFDIEHAAVTPGLIFAQLLGPQITAHLVLLAWAIAAGDRDRPGGARRWHLVLWVGAALALDAWCTPRVLYDWFGLPSVYQIVFTAKAMEMPPAWLFAGAEFVVSALFASFAIALGERWRVQRDAAAALAQADATGAQLRHRLIEARLAAMQAQVEPQFLFDTLVRIEAAYQRDTAGAAQALDRLIAFLRLALPGVRTGGVAAGSTLAAEAALVQAYLAVIDACGGAGARGTLDIDAACASDGVSPMLLLPLVQAAARQAGGAPFMVALVGRPAGADALQITMRIRGAAVDEQAPEFAHVRERLEALYDRRAVFHCARSEAGGVDLDLMLPRQA